MSKIEIKNLFHIDTVLQGLKSPRPTAQSSNIFKETT
jgi:hypothetical protein